jgi:dolichol-phosphate mannosyltransferase
MTAPLELSVVMPVYNEGAAVARVVRSWAAELDRLGASWELLVLDDGSKDDTGAVLNTLANEIPALRVLRHPNRGHGPTVLRGYAESRGEWVFQTDSDGEIAPDHLRDFWARRDDYDVIVGRRVNRAAPLVRRAITAVSRGSVGWLFGRGISDVNVPYRLMRGSALRAMVAAIPPTMFAPNVVLSGLAIREQLRILEIPVAHVGRTHGRSSLGRLSILRPATRSLLETLRVARAMRPRSRP